MVPRPGPGPRAGCGTRWCVWCVACTIYYVPYGIYHIPYTIYRSKEQPPTDVIPLKGNNHQQMSSPLKGINHVFPIKFNNIQKIQKTYILQFGYSFYKKYVFFTKWVCLVWKMFPDPVGVFCALPEPPNCHIVQKSKF